MQRRFITDQASLVSFHVPHSHYPLLQHHLDFGLGLHGLSSYRDFDVLVRKVHFSSEGRVRLPLARGAGSSLLQHLVDLLERQALGLWHEEVGAVVLC